MLDGAALFMMTCSCATLLARIATDRLLVWQEKPVQSIASKVGVLGLVTLCSPEQWQV